MPEQVVPIRSRRRDVAQLLQKLQHVLPAAALLFQGVSRLQHEPHGWSLLLAAGEVGISVLVVGAFIRTVRAARRTHDADHGDAHASHGVDWVDLLIGAMLGVEVWAHWYESGHIKRPTVVMAVGIFVVGLLHGRSPRAGGGGWRSRLTTPGSPSAAGHSRTSPPPGTSWRPSRSKRIGRA